MTIGKTRLAAEVADSARITKAQAEDAVETMFTAIVDFAARGDRITIQGFGTFELKTRAARTRRNPQTGLPVEVPAKSVLTFRAAKPKV